jgi:hypothetical protein
VKAKSSSFTSAAAARFCFTERTPAIRSALSSSASCSEICTCSRPAALNRSARGRVKPSPDVTRVV